MNKRMLAANVLGDVTIPVLYLGQVRNVPLAENLRVKVNLRGFIEFGRIVEIYAKRGRVKVKMDDGHPRVFPVSDIFAAKPDEASRGVHSDWLIHQPHVRRIGA